MRNEKTQAELIEELEANGLEFDPDGPEVIQCPHCGQALQYYPDHTDCEGMGGEEWEARHNEQDYI